MRLPLRRSLLTLVSLLGLAFGPHAASALPALYAISYPGSTGSTIWELDPVTYEIRGRVFDGGELTSPAAITQGPDGDIYIMNSEWGVGAELHRYDGATREHLGVVLPLSSTSGLPLGDRMLIADNGDLYISGGGYQAPTLYRFDLDTGALVGSLPGVFEAFAFAPDGQLYAASLFTNQVDRYDPETFQKLGSYWSAPDPSRFVRYLAFDGSGNLYAVDYGYDPNGGLDSSEVFRLAPNGTQSGASGRADDQYGGPYDFELNPFTGEVLSSTDDPYIFEWDLNGGGRSTASGRLDTGGETLWPYEFVVAVVPEPSGALLLGVALGALAIRRLGAGRAGGAQSRLLAPEARSSP